MIENIGIIYKPLENLIRFLRGYCGKPEITLTLIGNGSARGPSNIPGKVYYQWHRELVLHNDSAHLIRGIKLLQPFPPPWTMSRAIPTKLEADEKVEIPIEARLEEDYQQLLNRYGLNMQKRLKDDVFPSIVDSIVLEFELKNKQGRTVYQYSTIHEDGKFTTEISSKRRAHANI